MTPSNPGPNRRSASSMPDPTGNVAPKQKIDEDTREAKREVGAEAREKAEAGQHRLADETDALSDAIDAAASSLDDQDREGLARYARELSSNLAKAAEQLEGRSVDELANDAKRLARDNPALYMLGSIAVGFGLSRFFKASAERDHDDDGTYRNDDTSRDDDAYRPDAYRSDRTFLDDDISTGTPVQPRERDMMEMDSTSTAPRSGDGREMP
ncbi:hypothetical protein [Halomonas chromatireducens]|uniref:Uncharacterized protein n=1 Tax=Halomonas chromatireducens TaxID=507626 RepID=A0A0X8HBT6_9GAMM|nr:hypothetical protein [Halomonas chromatireducens]AMC99709.1 hypothetical protein LOKO_00623 [Halomonas chromatireducens]